MPPITSAPTAVRPSPPSAPGFLARLFALFSAAPPARTGDVISPRTDGNGRPVPRPRPDRLPPATLVYGASGGAPRFPGDPVLAPRVVAPPPRPPRPQPKATGPRAVAVGNSGGAIVTAKGGPGRVIVDSSGRIAIAYGMTSAQGAVADQAEINRTAGAIPLVGSEISSLANTAVNLGQLGVAVTDAIGWSSVDQVAVDAAAANAAAYAAAGAPATVGLDRKGGGMGRDLTAAGSGGDPTEIDGGGGGGIDS